MMKPLNPKFNIKAWNNNLINLKLEKDRFNLVRFSKELFARNFESLD